MRIEKLLLLGLVLLGGCATGTVSPGMTLRAGIHHYQGEMEVFSTRPERWPERQRMGDFLKLTFAAALGGSPEFNRLVDLDLRKREFAITLLTSSLPPKRITEMKEEISRMNEEEETLKAAVKRQIAAIPVATQEPDRRIEGIATIGLLTIAIDGFSAKNPPSAPGAQATKVGPYLVTEIGDGASVQTWEGRIYLCSTFVVEDEGVGIKCEPVRR